MRGQQKDTLAILDSMGGQVNARFIKQICKCEYLMNVNVGDNYSRLKPSLFCLPISLLIAIALVLYSKDSLNTDKYIQIQKDCFFFVNYNLGQFPDIIYNVTLLGDASIILSFLSIFILYNNKMYVI